METALILWSRMQTERSVAKLAFEHECVWLQAYLSLDSPPNFQPENNEYSVLRKYKTFPLLFVWIFIFSKFSKYK